MPTAAWRRATPTARPFFPLSDPLGTPRVWMTSGGAVSQDCANLAFGDGATCTADGVQFTGQIHDSATGLDNFKARYYSPMLGRFLTPDPAGAAAVDPNDPQTRNRYAYVNNSPLAATDPLGLTSSQFVPCMPVAQNDPTNEGPNGGASGGYAQHSASGPSSEDGGYSGCAGFSSAASEIWLDGAEVDAEFGATLETPDSSFTGVCLSLFPCSEDTASAQAAEAFVNDIPAPVGPPNQQQVAQCVASVVSAVNSTFHSSFTTAEATGVYDANGGEVNVGISGDVTAAQFDAINPGRYSPTLLTTLTGLGPSLHVPSGPSPIDLNATQFEKSGSGGLYSVSFTAHLDSDFAWNPVGAVAHYYTDVLGSATRNYCPAY